MLGIVQFNIIIDDLELKALSEVVKFTADNKLFKTVKMKADHEELQEDLRKMNEQPIKWQMKFSIDKCQAMYRGMSRPTHAAQWALNWSLSLRNKILSHHKSLYENVSPILVRQANQR